MRVARVRGWADVGACSAEGVGDGPNPAGGRLGHRSRCPGFRSGFYFLEPCPRKPVKQHNRCFYWLTRDVAVGLAGFRPPGRVKEKSSTLGDFLTEIAMSP